MQKDFLPYHEMKAIFEKTTNRDPIAWSIATGKIWVLRLAFNLGMRKRDLTKDHLALAFYKAEQGMILEILYILQCVDQQGKKNRKYVKLISN